MRKLTPRIILIVAALVITVSYGLATFRHPPVVRAAMSGAGIFLKMNGFKGAATDPNQKDALEIKSFNWGAAAKVSNGNGGGAATGKILSSDFELILKSSPSTPQILQAVLSQQHIKDASLTVVSPDGQEMRIKLSDVTIMSYKINANNQDPMSLDQISMKFAKLEMEYKDLAGASSKAGWNFKSNTKI